MRTGQYINSQSELREITRDTLQIIPPKVQDFKKECKICFSSQECSSNQFINPCQCTGSMRYVHQLCIREWLQVKAIRDAENQHFTNTQVVQCELCKQNIQVEMQILYHCRPIDQVKKRISSKRFLFVICVIGMMFSLGLLIYSSLQIAIQVSKGYSTTELSERLVVIIAFAINFLLLFYFIYHMIKFFIFKTAQIKLKSRSK